MKIFYVIRFQEYYFGKMHHVTKSRSEVKEWKRLNFLLDPNSLDL